jgi:hypothetical protein
MKKTLAKTVLLVDDEYFRRGLQRRLETGAATHRMAHVKPLAKAAVPPQAESVAASDSWRQAQDGSRPGQGRAPPKEETERRW